MLLDPLPLSQTVTTSWTPSPLERDVLKEKTSVDKSLLEYMSRKLKIICNEHELMIAS